MNKEKLNTIAAKPDLIDAGDARELEELTRNFPYFSLPFVLLSHYYLQQNDYRFEDTLQKTALRVKNREWLQSFLYPQPSAPINGETEKIAETEELVASVAETTLNHNVENDVDAISEITIENTPKTEVTLDAKLPEEETLTVYRADSMFEIDLEPLDKSTALLDEDAVFEEISDFAEPVSIDEQQVKEDQALIETMSRAGILKPMISEDVNDEGVEEIQEAVIAENNTTDTEEEVFEEISADFAVLNTGTIENNDVYSKDNEPWIEKNVTYGSAVYNIEDYYSVKETNPQPNDFFGWLSHPKNQLEPAAPAVTGSEKVDLITKFLQNKPSISRPKAEFYNPIEVAKKSEIFPEDIVTETLANVYLHQQRPEKTLEIYERLMAKNPEKSAYFAALISKIKKEHNL